MNRIKITTTLSKEIILKLKKCILVHGDNFTYINDIFEFFINNYIDEKGNFIYSSILKSRDKLNNSDNKEKFSTTLEQSALNKIKNAIIIYYPEFKHMNEVLKCLVDSLIDDNGRIIESDYIKVSNIAPKKQIEFVKNDYINKDIDTNKDYESEQIGINFMSNFKI